MITGDDFIHVAGRWAADPKVGEALLRTAVGRAYYGAFHIALAFLDGLGVFRPPSDKRIHSFVRGALSSCDVPEAKRVGIRLSDLCERRNNADYQLSDDRWGTSRYARESVEFAHEIRSLLNECENAGAEIHRQMRESIEAWRNRSKL